MSFQCVFELYLDQLKTKCFWLYYCTTSDVIVKQGNSAYRTFLKKTCPSSTDYRLPRGSAAVLSFMIRKVDRVAGGRGGD